MTVLFIHLQGRKKNLGKKVWGKKKSSNVQLCSKQTKLTYFVHFTGIVKFHFFQDSANSTTIKKEKKITYFDIITGSSTDVTERLYSGKLLSAHWVIEDGVRVSVSSSSVLTKLSLLASVYAIGKGQLVLFSFWNGWFLQRSKCTALLLAGYFGESSNWDELLVCEKVSVSQWLENPGSAIESGEKGVVSSGILKEQRPGFCWPGFICRVGSNVKI